MKILQFGEGNFLRAFADYYFNELNKEGGNYEVDIVKPIPFGNFDKFKKQNNVYHVVLRGMANGREVEDVHEITCVKKAISPFDEYEEYTSLAKDEELKVIVSNTTEAGICFNENDDVNGFEKITYPAKLTKFLFERFKAGLSGLYVLPVELIDDNADELYRCVSAYINLWKLPEEFKAWVDKENYFCNTLVDRIVSGYPKDEKTRAHLTDLIGEADELMTIGEPFGLWVVEDKGNVGEYIKAGVHGIEVVLTKDVKYYKKRKVRVLNGSHTNLVPVGLWKGFETVYDCMKDKEMSAFITDTLEREIIPFVSDDVAATKVFADGIVDRFMNPFLNHMLTSIALNSISKWRARDLPSFKDYYARYGEIPVNLATGFSYLMAIYKSVKKGTDGKYYAALPTKKTELNDDAEYLEYFANGGCVIDFMKNEKAWGEDLTKYSGFAEFVKRIVHELSGGKCNE